MKISGGLQEDGIVVGNAYDKYGSRNPAVRWIMRGFDDSLAELVAISKPGSIHEVGCGEGFWTLSWYALGIATRGSDFSKKVIDLARSNASMQGVKPDLFEVCSVYELQPGRDSADLVVCCEVLEHLENPRRALEALQRIATHHVVISVPREPLWRLLNMARGKYLKNLGNTPGHIQHWSKNALIDLVGAYFEIVEVRTPIPWTMMLCRARTQR